MIGGEGFRDGGRVCDSSGGDSAGTVGDIYGQRGGTSDGFCRNNGGIDVDRGRSISGDKPRPGVKLNSYIDELGQEAWASLVC